MKRWIAGVLGLLLTGTAQAEGALAPGELYGHRSGWIGNAYTMPKGQYSISALSRSAVGITERIDVKVPLLGAVIGPKISSELGLIQGERFAASIEPLVWFYTWGGALQEVSATGRASAAVGPGLLNSGLTCAYVNSLLQEPTIDLRLEVNYELILSDHHRLIVAGRTNLAEGGASSAGLYFATGAQNIGMSLGVNVGYLDLSGPQSTLSAVGLGDRIPTGQLLPLPHLQLWIRG